MAPPRIVATPHRAPPPVDVEPILEGLELGSEARDNLAGFGGLAPADLGSDGAWAARVDVDGTSLIARGDGARWSIFPGSPGLPAAPDPAGPGASDEPSDEAALALAARRLHGAIGAQAADWDLDR